ncbi:MAG: flagellar biosynthesis anti-sigma factor FlgM [Comamonadaceae bacterium CG12_big_fil_rev_8_21_14_0_65_59_15]|nr:MAG: flagellar biosynthesis anti-sigma factor FlgM [Comamonadaceae bacterium CG12_big_fil_rev_8_21_14_0_65_59_15]
MKISQPTEKPIVAGNKPSAANAKSAPAASLQARSAAAEGTRSAGVAVTVSALARTLDANNAGEAPDVDLGKVQTVRAAIADGTYVVNPGVIADKLLANAQEMLQRQTSI